MDDAIYLLLAIYCLMGTLEILTKMWELSNISMVYISHRAMAVLPAQPINFATFIANLKGVRFGGRIGMSPLS